MQRQWKRAAELEGLWARGCDAETYIDQVLEALIEEVPVNTAVVMVGHASGVASPWRGRGREGQLPPGALEEVSRSIVEEALKTGQLASWDAAFGGGGNESARVLGVRAAVAVPLGRPVRGVLYVDFRNPSGVAHAARSGALEEAARLLAEVIAPTDFKPAVPVVEEEEEAPPPTLDAFLSLPGLRAMMRDVGASIHGSAPVLILGETGTGKTLFAQSLAARVGRRPVVRAMLGTSDDPNTIVSELYGHLKGSFSGALATRKGVVEQADGGVLILDELLNLPLATQQLLLDFIQFGTYRPLGYDRAEPRRANVRVFAVTNGDVEGAVRDGRFRQDLYYRLAGTVLNVPPLRARRGDIPGLAAILLRRLAAKQPWRLSLEARRILISERLEWPGNVRQLEASLRRSLERARMEPGLVPWEVSATHLDPDLVASAAGPSLAARRPPPSATGDAAVVVKPSTSEAAESFSARWQLLQARRAELDQEERALVNDALSASGGVLAHAAKSLGIPRTTLASRFGERGRAGG